MAEATARTAFGFPIEAAIYSYVNSLPGGNLRRASQTLIWKFVPLRKTVKGL